ncbi:MAG TPA: DNA-processing protein DprA [Stenotrophomonas sp.]|nr:DNA-processing protein DprA [Stenotrophomonas sp.]
MAGPVPLPADERTALLMMLLAHGPASARRELLGKFGSARAALRAGLSAWRAAGCTPEQCQALAHPPRAALAHASRWLDAPGHHLLGLGDPAYPPLLREIALPPLALFVDGEPALLRHPGVAIVGSRRPSAGGADLAREFASSLAGAGLVVVSGMAAGIDAAAHQAALGGSGLSVAVLGSGPDVAYPARHAALRSALAERGAVVSEYLPGTGPATVHFPARNRIVAGLALGTLVVEAAFRSGALITARLAGESGREVFAIPGSVRNPLARGCHRLIRDGAVLVEAPEDVLAVLGPLALAQGRGLPKADSVPIEHPGPGRATGAGPSPPFTDPHYQSLWQALGHDPTPMDSLVHRTGLTAATLSSMLLAMELEGRVVAEHGRYTRNP